MTNAYFFPHGDSRHYRYFSYLKYRRAWLERISKNRKISPDSSIISCECHKSYLGLIFDQDFCEVIVEFRAFLQIAFQLHEGVEGG